MKPLAWVFYPFREIIQISYRVVIFWPTTPFGNWIRSKIYARQLKKMGTNPIFESGVRISAGSLIEIGDNCIFGRNAHVNAGNCNGIVIGNDVAIADGVYLRSSNHNTDRIDIPIKYQGHTAATVSYKGSVYSMVIEDDVWIGARAIILSGAYIGNGSVISAGAVVSNIIPPYSIVVGNPGRVIANREKKLIQKNENI